MSGIEERWQEEHAKYPGMTKDTFVRNVLFGQELDGIREWLCDQTDLHGEIFMSTGTWCREFIQRPDPDRPGWKFSQADLSKPHVVTRIQIEVVTDGRSRILSPVDRWCDA